MSTKLTRKALYELVWSQPRTHIAKAMGVSDVWIGKQCSKLNVPAPPAGYWASRASGKRLKSKYQRPPLSYTVAERMQEDHDSTAAAFEALEQQNPSEALPKAPDFGESLEAAVARYTELVGKEVGRRRSQGQHPVVQKQLDEDVRRAAAKSPYSWEQPSYRTAAGEVTLAAINAIASYWAACGFSVTASGRRDVRLAVAAPSYTRSFEVTTAPATSGATTAGRSTRQVHLALWLDVEHREPRVKSNPSLAFDKPDAGAMEALTALLITKCEESFRARMVWRRERIVADRIQVLRAAEAADRKAREEREAAVLALNHKRERLLLDAMDDAKRAREIRDLVAGLSTSLGASGVSQHLLESWSAWALKQADALDPLVQDPDTLTAWLRSFNLDA